MVLNIFLRKVVDICTRRNSQTFNILLVSNQVNAKNNKKNFNAIGVRFSSPKDSLMPTSLEDKFLTVRKHRFLFLKSQYILKLIKHLKYLKKDVLVDTVPVTYL